MRTLKRLLVAMGIASLCLVDSAPGIGAGKKPGSLAGNVVIYKDGRPRSDHAGVVVYLEGVPRSARAAGGRHVIRQKNEQFQPQVSVVTRGTTVDFPNDDRIYHNVFSTSRAARFDLGLYRGGASKSVNFRREGVVDVFCNIHPEMNARVLVLDTDSYAMTDAQGRFRIGDIPPGTYPVVAWQAHGEESRGTVTIESGKVATVALKVREGRKPAQHRRKDGTPYGRYE